MLPIPISPIDHIFVIVKINFNYIILGNVYFPPRSPISVYVKHVDIINVLLVSFPYVRNVIICGDYNLSNIKWQYASTGCLPNYFNISHFSSDFLSKISFLNLSQINTVLNNNGNILDLIFSNMDSISVSQFMTPLVSCDAYHPSLLMVIPFQNYKPIEYNFCTFLFL